MNGLSGDTPPTYEAAVGRLQEFPSRETIEYLGTLRIRWLVVHRELVAPAGAARWQSVAPSKVGLRRVAEFGPDISLGDRPPLTAKYGHPRPKSRQDERA